MTTLALPTKRARSLAAGARSLAAGARPLVAAFLLLGVLAACGERAAETVAVADSPLGAILTDAEGRTLYAFLNDSGATSSCTGDCAETWPPLVVEGQPGAGEGADGALLGTTSREDGSTQVTYGGWPLYHFSGDDAPSDTNGQGLNDVWFVVAPDGEPVRGD